MDDEGLDLDALEQALATGRATRRSSTRSRPSRIRAAARSPPSGAAGSSSSPTSRNLLVLGGRSVRARPLRRRSAADAVRARRRRARRILVVLLEDDRAGPARRLLHPARARSSAELEAIAVSTYITPVLLGQATVYEFLRRGIVRTEPRARARVARRPAGRDARGARAASSRRHSWSRPDGGYFVWLELPENVGRRGAARAGGGCRRHVREGDRLRRRAQHRAACVQLRLARRDPRGRATARCARRGAGRGLAALPLPGRSRQAAAARGAAGAAERASRGCAGGTSDTERPSGVRKARRDGSSSRRTSAVVRLLNLLACLRWGAAVTRRDTTKVARARQGLSRMKTKHFPAVSILPKSAAYLVLRRQRCQRAQRLLKTLHRDDPKRRPRSASPRARCPHRRHQEHVDVRLSRSDRLLLDAADPRSPCRRAGSLRSRRPCSRGRRRGRVFSSSSSANARPADGPADPAEVEADRGTGSGR